MKTLNISSRNLIARFRDAFDNLAECDEDLLVFRTTFTEEEWQRFVNHAAGFITSSLWMSEEKLNTADNKDEV